MIRFDIDNDRVNAWLVNLIWIGFFLVELAFIYYLVVLGTYDETKIP